jgi:hypothetical protein
LGAWHAICAAVGALSTDEIAFQKGLDVFVPECTNIHINTEKGRDPILAEGAQSQQRGHGMAWHGMPCTKSNIPGPSVVPAANEYPNAGPHVERFVPSLAVNVSAVRSTNVVRAST